MKSSAPTLSRRRFLLAAGAGGAATVAAVSIRENPETQPAKVAEARSGKGYHVTEHIRKYYNTAKV
jgi:hypothetical protein